MVLLYQIYLLPDIFLDNVNRVNLLVISFNPFFKSSDRVSLILDVKVHASQNFLFLCHHSKHLFLNFCTFRL